MKTLLLFFFFLSGHFLFGQEVSVSVLQDLSFGDFYVAQGSGNATVTVGSNGSWSYTGEVYQVNQNHKPAIFSISTESSAPIKIQVHTNSADMSNATGTRLLLSAEETSTRIFTIQKGAPLTLPVGAELHLSGGAGSDAGVFTGDFRLWVTVLNE